MEQVVMSSRYRCGNINCQLVACDYEERFDEFLKLSRIGYNGLNNLMYYIESYSLLNHLERD